MSAATDRPEVPEAAAVQSLTAPNNASWQSLIDAMPCGIVVFDAQDRLVLWNADFERIYGEMAADLVPGRSFESLLRKALARGLVPEAFGCEEAWIADRLRAHAQPQGPHVRRMADGRWRQIVETRLADGGLLAFSVDITEQVEQAEQAQLARQAAEIAAQWLEDAVEALPAGFELWDSEDRLVLRNSELGRLYPRIAEALQPGTTWETAVRANHAAGGLALGDESIDDYIDRRRASRRAGVQIETPANSDGRWIRSFERRTRDGGIVAVRIDVSEIRQQRLVAEAARAEAEAATRRLHDAIDALPDGFALYDADDRLVVCNARYRELYKASADAMTLGTRFEDILRHGLAHGQYPQALGREAEWLAQRLYRHRNPGPPEIQQLPDNRWLRIDEQRTCDGGVAGVRTEVTELVRREQQLVELNARLNESRAALERLSDTDSLTGVANRRQFDRRLAEEWDRMARHHVPLTLMLLDLDHFKRFNDHHGHPAGDACLRRVAEVLTGFARRPADLVARYGGEEFAVLMPHTSAEVAAGQVIRCLEDISAAAIPHGFSPVAPIVTASIGVAVAAKDSKGGPTVLLGAADAALYRAKAAGRNRAEFADG